jgi:hypothetical protein
VSHLFVKAGSEYYASAPVALQNVCDANNASTFSYGEFYVTLSLEKAYRYAMRGRSYSFTGTPRRCRRSRRGLPLRYSR